MPSEEISVFVVDCPKCRMPVAAKQSGVAERTGYVDETMSDRFGERLYVGKCPRCSTLLAGESNQTDFADVTAEYDDWSPITRVYPEPPRRFSSSDIPSTVTESLREAELSLRADANTAACVMMGRALEALCRDKLTGEKKEALLSGRRIMLGEGIRHLLDAGVIDQRLFDWSQELQAFRNIAAHPDDALITREDAKDLQSFVFAIVEYIYDLSERFEEFRARNKKRMKRRTKP